jgi:hypothetical protein
MVATHERLSPPRTPPGKLPEHLETGNLSTRPPKFPTNTIRPDDRLLEKLHPEQNEKPDAKRTAETPSTCPIQLRSTVDKHASLALAVYEG